MKKRGWMFLAVVCLAGLGLASAFFPISAGDLQDGLAALGPWSPAGYILLFTDTETYRRHISKIMEFYHLKKDLFEYSEQIVSMDDGVMEWQEELFLLSSEDSLVLIYPKDSDGC